ncbi:MAG: tetratricopeptide repeat protein [bacterium]|nr:MAG: tetratricopeptide repeat protein [bacterium]
MTTLMYTGIGIAVVIILAVIYFALRFPKKKRDATIEYTTALNYLIIGEKRKALEKLRESLRLNTSNIDAYIKIGDILREQGSVDRAIKIHRGLTVRSNLTSAQKIDILKSLIKDYQAIEKYDRAIFVCQKLLEMTHNEVWVREIMLKLYERSRDWDGAFDILKKIQKQKDEKNGKLLALYKVEAGLKCIEQGKERDGRIKFREAIKLDKKCSPAYLYLSDSYIRENRYNDALTELKKFSSEVPQLSYLGFARIKDILFHEGIFGEVEKIFESLLQDNPDNESIRFSLADIYERKGELSRAIDLCHEALERNLESQQAKRYLAKFLTLTGNKERALQYALDLIENLMDRDEEQFTCNKCGFVSQEPKWRCPQCHEWNSFL